MRRRRAKLELCRHALARLRIIKEYESLAEESGCIPA